MSIYATWLGFEDDDHKDECAKWVPAVGGEAQVAVYVDGRRMALDDSKACTCRCGPIEYQGSHVFPSDDDKRKGVVHLCAIPGFLTRNGYDEAHEDGATVQPWLRLSVNQETVVLDHGQVKSMQSMLTDWLAAVRDA